ncbi:hypothetical protein [Trinickia sp. EG282A]|uniref:hypothetical protein n=1 Tax=Trinickia sp. EG282A TaxID=3237013 RepID=UPI0034D37E84
MNASRLISGAPRRRARLAPGSGPGSLEPAAAARFRVAVICLLASYALAWVEIPLEFAFQPGQTSAAGASALLAAIVARVLLGALYVFVALHRAWARWIAVSLGFLAAFFVTPMLPGEWHVFPLAAIVTGLGVIGKLAAAILLMLPLRRLRVAQ